MNSIYKSNNIVSRQYDDLSVIYDLKFKNYVILNSVGSDIWSYINSHEKSISFNQLVQHICKLYDESPTNIIQDIESFIKELFNNNIIEIDEQHYVGDSSQVNTIATNDIEGEIINIMRERNQLYSVTFELTYSCNEKCIHCYATYPDAAPQHKHLNLESCKRIIDELYEMNCFHLSFTGGDPFMFKDFIELLKYAREKNFVFDVYTNALALANNPEYISQIQALFPRTFYISLYGSTSSTHDSVTQINNSFDKTLFAIKALHSANIRVVLNMMIMKPNHKEISSMIQLANELGVDYRIGMSIISKNNGDKTPLEFFIDDTNVIENILSSTNRDSLYTMNTQVGTISTNGLICGAGTTSLCISPDGEVFPCVSLKTSLGSVFSMSISDIWKNTSRLNFVSSLTWENTTDCKSCDLRSYCSHCIGISYAETSNAMTCNNCDRTIAQCTYNISKSDF